MQRITRRQCLALGSWTATGILLAQCSKRSLQSPPLPNTVNVMPYKAIAQPHIYSSVDGLLSLELIAQPQTVSLGDRTAHLLTYNGQTPGPQIEAQPGDTVQIRFTNRLNQPTNLHYHGLHIPPTGDGDNVFLSVPPGEQHTYNFHIPLNHPAGTFWYHPHAHGKVAEQLFEGLAGIFIVRGELDKIPEIKAAQEAVLVIKDWAIAPDGTIPDPGHMAQMTGRIGDLLTVNGLINPTVPITQGGLLRLRLLNASSSRFFRLALEGHPCHLIATDGGAIATPVELDSLVLAPGERAEVLVQGNQPPGQYRLLNYPFNPAQGMMHRKQGLEQQSRSEVVATIAYQGQTKPRSLPHQLIPVEPLPPPDTLRAFTLSHGMGTGSGDGMGHGMGMHGNMVFLINGQAFDSKRIDTTVRLNTVEDWDIINTGAMTHPFHVHVNSFQVISHNNQLTPYLAWKDVVSVSPGERVRIRLHFRDYVGKTVYHCHILDHEDQGMMGILEITPA